MERHLDALGQMLDTPPPPPCPGPQKPSRTARRNHLSSESCGELHGWPTLVWKGSIALSVQLTCDTQETDDAEFADALLGSGELNDQLTLLTPSLGLSCRDTDSGSAPTAAGSPAGPGARRRSARSNSPVCLRSLPLPPSPAPHSPAASPCVPCPPFSRTDPSVLLTSDCLSVTRFVFPGAYAKPASVTVEETFTASP